MLYIFFLRLQSPLTHEYYMLLLLEGRFEGNSLKLKHPSRQRILLCWTCIIASAEDKSLEEGSEDILPQKS